MTTYTPRLDLPFIEAAQAQKHVTHNQALERLDTMVPLRVQRFDATTPASVAPSTVSPGPWGKLPQESGPVTAARSQATQAMGWLFITPGPGWRPWGLAEDTRKVWDGAT